MIKNEITHIKKDVIEIRNNAESNFQEIKSLIKEHNTRSDEKFENIIKHKADKCEVNSLQDKVNKVIYSGLIALVAFLISIVAFLLKEQLFR